MITILTDRKKHDILISSLTKERKFRMSSYQRKKTPGDTSWFVHDRFGMFIHWGLYALPARHEWIQNYECIPPEKYRAYFDHFDPDLYDPKDWAKQAKACDAKL